MVDEPQYELPLIAHEAAGEIIQQRAKDGYIDATAMCAAAGKKFNDYSRIGPTQAFIAELSAETGLPVTELIQSVSGGVPQAHHIESVAPQLPALFGPDTMVMTVQNGLPWWYFQKHGGAFDGRRLESLDPNGVIEANIEAGRILGCVVYPAGAVTAPGVIHHREGDRFPVGEPDNTESERLQRVHDTIVEAGFRSRILTSIRSEIWLKAWGNLSFNPISSLTHATLVDMCEFPETAALAASMMREAADIAGKLGIEFRHTIERRIEGARNVGAHKTSMLQDVEAGRSLEVEALIGAVMELGRLTETPCPHIGAVYACVKLLDHTMAKESARIAVEKVSVDKAA